MRKKPRNGETGSLTIPVELTRERNPAVILWDRKFPLGVGLPTKRLVTMSKSQSGLLESK